MRRLIAMRAKLWRVCIYSLLIALVAVAVFVVAEIVSPSQIGGSKLQSARLHLMELRYKLDHYRREKGEYPPEKIGWAALVNESASPSPRYLGFVSVDPWGHPFVYRHEQGTDTYLIYSLGLNGIDEHVGGDDVTSTSKTYSCAEYGENCPRKPVEIIKIIALCCAAISLLSFILSSLMLCISWIAAKFLRPGR